MRNVRISVPSTAQAGELVEIKTLITHPMETGFRRDNLGNAIPRDILSRFECAFEGDVIFSANLHPGVAANPYLSFFYRVAKAGTLTFTWTDMAGVTTRETRTIAVP